MTFLKKHYFLIIIFLLFPAVAYPAILLDRVAAIVDREVITWSELYRALSIEQRPITINMSPEEKKAYLEKVQYEFIDKLINMKLQVAAAKNAGFTVSSNELKAAINDIRKQYHFTLSEFKKALEKDGIEFDEYKKTLKDQILVNKIIASEIRGKVIVTDSEVDEYIKSNSEDLPLEVSYKLLEVHLKGRNADKGKLEEIKERIIARIDLGESLENIVKPMRDKIPGIIEYQTGHINESELRNDFRSALNGLNEGQVTAPIYTQNDIYFLKILKKESPVKLDVLKDKIRNLLISNKTEELHKSWIKQLRQNAFIEIKL